MRAGSIFPFLLLLSLGAALAVGCACSNPEAGDAGADAAEACEGVTPYCAQLHGRCCDDWGFAATCRGGEWVCDTCALGEAYCAAPFETCFVSECERWALDLRPEGVSFDEYCEIEGE